MAAGALTQEVVEEVAVNLEEVAQATRQLDPRALGFFFGGVVAGAGVGFYFGYKYNRQKIRAEVLLEADAQIAQMREYYQQKTVAAEAKPELDQIIEQRGYSTHADRPLAPPVPIIETPTSLVEPAPENTEKNKDEGWNYPAELERRSPNAPYVIHEDEFRESEHDYLQTTYTYWEGDDVLTDVDNAPVIDREGIVGMENLKWGHGSGDVNVVFVRNDRLEMEVEINRDPRSWEEEVQGLDGPEGALRHSHQNHPARRRR